MSHLAFVGWDVGGANLKAVRLEVIGGEARPTVVERAFELWREPAGLVGELAALLREIGQARWHAVTMTAELADCFKTKREGVRAVLAALSAVLAGREVRVFTVNRSLVTVAEALREPLIVAGANWAASASWLAADIARTAACETERYGILLDVGSTTTDVVPFSGGELLARGRTDPERLIAGELVYTGASRTPMCAILRTAPLWGAECPVAAEHFAIAADAHVWLGDLPEDGYTCATPDGGPATRAGAAARLARIVCADVETLTEDDLTAIARRAAEAQVDAIAEGLGRVIGRLAAELQPDRAPACNVFTAGSGAWLGERAADRCGLPTQSLAERLGAVARVLPAYSVARLLSDSVQDHRMERATPEPTLREIA